MKYMTINNRKVAFENEKAQIARSIKKPKSFDESKSFRDKPFGKGKSLN